ncbi:MAG: dephospho-CoA kinase [Ruminococcus sp.]|nr:dephospho-CoA kinase [Ruminococcus sp.]
MSGLENVVVVGLTGQTGAGKSTVSAVFAESGFSVIDADIVSRMVMEKGSDCLSEVAEIFGEGVIKDDGTLNRRLLADIVFSDKAKLETLNSITYPYITREILNQINHFAENDKKFILLDAPTLFESRADDFCEIIISVMADSQIRKQRIIRRDGITSEQAEKRMSSQLDETFFAEHSDYIIHNNSSPETAGGIAKELAEKIIDCYQNK